MADSNATDISEAPTNTPTTRHNEVRSGQDDPTYEDSGDKAPSVSRKEILEALEAVERDSAAIADSFSNLFASLRSSLSEATSSTAEHMSCFSDAAGRLQETVLDASTKGNRYINSCLRSVIAGCIT
ncbi:hypothetical protein F511_14302 [Dorcoceras hygrometricum]|uniref:BLOC-1-related complex subunit 6 C-terminal helix domain-containing protein n=1 Tax=Dorcoceras hygrometricum TaxID=472368 RepID=A0A2Z7BPJ9_9LAMI|nr:hypothetical protein F511_14302 [Dorcoceras hygrometricum]